MTRFARSPAFVRSAVVVLVGSLAGLAGGLPVCADDATSRYFEQLRRRGLFSLAEGACLDRLARDDLSPRRRAEFTLELSRTFAEHARYTADGEQDDLWSRAAQAIDDLVEAEPGNPLRARLDVRRALVPVARGESLRWQAELFPHDDRLGERARSVLTDAVSRLRGLEASLDEALRNGARGRARERGEAISARELRALGDNVRLELGAALLAQSKLLPAGSPERVAALIDAERWLDRLATRDPGDETAWRARVLLAESARLRGDARRAAALLDAIQKTSPPAQAFDRTVAQRVWLMLEAERPADAAKLLIDYRRLRKGLPGELSFLKVKTSIALWEIAFDKRDDQLAAELFEQVESHVERANVEVGGEWGYRCRLLLASARETQTYGRGLAPLIQKARALYRNGRAEEASAAYAEAAARAGQSRRNELAGELAYTQASIELEAGRFQHAADVLHHLAENYPDSKRTAAAHLLWAYCLGRLYDGERTKSRRTAYTEALRAHRKKFADDPTAIEAAWMLALLEESRLQVTTALKLYLEIPEEHPRGPQARVAIARCYEFILNRLRELNKPAGAWEQDALERLTAIVSGFPPEPKALSVAQADVAVRFARICLNLERPDYEQADRLLDRVASSWAALQDQDSAPRVPQRQAGGANSQQTDADEWQPLRTAATRLRIVSLAGRGEFERAKSLVAGLSDSSPGEVLGILDGLMELAGRIDDQTRRELGDLQLRMAAGLTGNRSELSGSDQRRLDRCLAEAYAALDRPEQAVRAYESLLAQSPDDRELLETAAKLLLEVDSPGAREKAKTYWRKLESFEKPGSPDWLAARYHVAACSLALGQHEECRKLLAVTRLLYPDLGGPELRSKFTALQSAVEKARQR